MCLQDSLSGKCRSQVKCGCVRGVKLGFPKFARKINQDLPLTILCRTSPTKKIQNISKYFKNMQRNPKFACKINQDLPLPLCRTSPTNKI